MAQWYIKGGFVDEYGKRHESGHHLKIDYWEVLNEQDGAGHDIDPQAYTRLYDLVVSQLRTVDPSMKFSGLALADAQDINYFEYFLNHKNHKSGTPLDMVSYHQYIWAKSNRSWFERQREMFADTDRFLTLVRKIEKIRRRLSPKTKTFISEFGLMWGPEADQVFATINRTETGVLC